MIALVIVGVSYAGDSPAAKTKAGDKGLIFTLYGLNNLGAGEFNGGIGGKYFFMDNHAVRFGIGFLTGSEEDPAGNKDEASAFSIYPAYLFHFATPNSVTAYTGIEVGFVTGSTEYKPALGTSSKSSTTMFSIGVLLGVEWFAWEHVSLGAEYQLGYMSQTEKVTPPGGTEQETKTSGFGTVAMNGTAFRITFYF